MVLVETLQQLVDAKSSHHRLSMYEFVLRYGRPFENQKLPSKYLHGFPRQCYQNAYLLAARHNLIYVEGYASGPEVHDIPIAHAWCCEPYSNLVIDCTTTLSEYYGVRFQWEYVRNHWRRMRQIQCSPLIDNWRLRFPLLKPESEILERVVTNDDRSGLKLRRIKNDCPC